MHFVCIKKRGDPKTAPEKERKRNEKETVKLKKQGVPASKTTLRMTIHLLRAKVRPLPSAILPTARQQSFMETAGLEPASREFRGTTPFQPPKLCR